MENERRRMRNTLELFLLGQLAGSSCSILRSSFLILHSNRSDCSDCNDFFQAGGQSRKIGLSVAKEVFTLDVKVVSTRPPSLSHLRLAVSLCIVFHQPPAQLVKRRMLCARCSLPRFLCA